jgi:DNA polymerase III epsilon subunit-like protein
MYLVYDCETSGLPVFTRYRGYYNPKDFSKYDTARIVSISWIILDANLEIVDKQTHIVKPDNFIIPQASIDIHHITNEKANTEGVNIHDVLSNLSNVTQKIHTIVAHNVYFDFNVLKSECFRYGYPSIIAKLDTSRKYCTMAMSKKLLALPKNPKLSELYQTLYDEEMKNAHDAEYDTYYCYKCFMQLIHMPERQVSPAKKRTQKPSDKATSSKKNPKFSFGDHEFTLNEEQANVVFNDPNKNMLVVASAGSGKTSSIICRIKHLVDSGTPEDSIVLTTFTRDAANDMETKLNAVFGYKPAIIVGTIDSLALKYVKKYQPELLQDNTNNVGEYAIQFLNFLKSTNAKEVFLKGITHLVVDEFQDINDIQYKIIREFSKNGIFITAIGDDAQNIYTFRGSNSKYILNFSNYFQDADHFLLTTNFRSSQEIVNFANATIEKNEFQIPKTMISYDKQPSGIRPKVHYFDRSKQQYNFICEKINEYIHYGYSLCQIAVLCPQNSFLYQLEEQLTKNNIPNVLLDGKSDIRTRIRKQHICLSTIHKSKGLEWDIVFLLMMNDEVFPSNKNNIEICESRRLFYVGVTRPKSILHITYAPILNSSYISRFVSELDRNLYEFYNFKPQCFGLSTNRIKITKLSVTALIEGLTGEDYINLKSAGLFYDFPSTTERRYAPYNYKPFITNNDIYADFGIFIDTLLSRMIGEIYEESGGLQNEPATCALNCLKLDSVENSIYVKYRYNFICNMSRIQDLYQNNNDTTMKEVISTFVTKSNNAVRSVESTDRSHIYCIICKLRIKSQKCDIAMDKIPIFTEAFLPKGFEKSMEYSLSQYKNKGLSWKDIIQHIWHVSKCHMIVRERRRRLLYKDIKINDVLDYSELYENMHNHIIEYVLKETKQCNNISVKCHELLRDNDTGIFGETDLRIGNTLYDFKCSNDEGIKAEHILQLLCYKQLYEQNNDDVINSIGIINPLKGLITVLDVSDYNNGSKLLKYLYDISDSKQNSI